LHVAEKGLFLPVARGADADYGAGVTHERTDARLVLGSASPRRREILTSLGIAHVVVPADVDESVRVGEAVGAYLDRVVAAKLDAVRAALAAGAHPTAGRAVLVADTSVVLGGDILGKPGSAGEALAMITRLAGRTHEVHTRFAIGCAGARDPAGAVPPLAPVAHVETVVTRVTFRALTPEEAASYATRGEGLDKAGGYAIQGFAAAFVPRIDGSYSNVVGLPASEVMVALGRLGLL
jgi:septum formation protein